MNHFDEMTVLLYLEGQLDADRAREVKEHAASCASVPSFTGCARERRRLASRITERGRRIGPCAACRGSRTRRCTVGLAHRSWPRRRRRIYVVELGSSSPGKRKRNKQASRREICSRCFSSAVHFGKDGTRCEAQWKSLAMATLGADSDVACCAAAFGARPPSPS